MLIGEIGYHIASSAWEVFKTMLDIVGMLIVFAALMALIAVPTIMVLQ
jgi:hypothetical protein